MRALAAVVAVASLHWTAAQTDSPACELVGCTEHQLVKAYQAVLDADSAGSCGDGSAAYTGTHTDDTDKYRCVTTGCTSDQIATQFLKHLDCNARCGSDNKPADCPTVSDQLRNSDATHFDDCTCENGLNKGPDCVDREAKLDKCTECADTDVHMLNANNQCVPFTIGLKQADITVPSHVTGYAQYYDFDNYENTACDNSQFAAAAHYSSLDECWNAVTTAFTPDGSTEGAAPEITIQYGSTDGDTSTASTLTSTLEKGTTYSGNTAPGGTAWSAYGCRVTFSEIHASWQSKDSDPVVHARVNFYAGDKATYGGNDGLDSKGVYFCKVPSEDSA